MTRKTFTNVIDNMAKLNVNQRDGDDYTPLIRAVQNGNEDSVRELLKDDRVDLNIRENLCGMTAEEFSRDYPEDSEIRKLFSRWHLRHKYSASNLVNFLNALNCCDTEVLQAHVDDGMVAPLNTNFKLCSDCWVKLPLIVAIEKNSPEMVKVLLNAGANPSAFCYVVDWSPMEFATNSGKDKIKQLLSKYKAQEKYKKEDTSFDSKQEAVMALKDVFKKLVGGNVAEENEDVEIFFHEPCCYPKSDNDTYRKIKKVRVVSIGMDEEEALFDATLINGVVDFDNITNLDFVERLHDEGLFLPGGKKVMPHDGKDFLEALLIEYSGSRLRARVVKESSTTLESKLTDALINKHNRRIVELIANGAKLTSGELLVHRETFDISIWAAMFLYEAGMTSQSRCKITRELIEFYDAQEDKEPYSYLAEVIEILEDAAKPMPEAPDDSEIELVNAITAGDIKKIHLLIHDRNVKLNCTKVITDINFASLDTEVMYDIMSRGLSFRAVPNTFKELDQIIGVGNLSDQEYKARVKVVNVLLKATMDQMS